MPECDRNVQNTVRTDKPRYKYELSDAGKMCFGVAAGALVAALLGAIVNLFLTGWMAVIGMLVVGLLYLGMGIGEIKIISTSEQGAASPPDEGAGKPVRSSRTHYTHSQKLNEEDLEFAGTGNYQD